MNVYYWMNSAVQDLLTGFGPLFLDEAADWMRIIGLLMILLHALNVLYGDSSAVPKFGVFVVRLVLCMTLVNFYSVPVPGMDNTLTGYITAGGADLANKIDIGISERMSDKFQEVILSSQQPAWYDIGAWQAAAHYFMTVLTVGAMQGIISTVVMFGWMAVGICKLLGPIFIPCMLVPWLEQFFWGWLATLVIYSFYPVVGNAFVYIMSHIMMDFFAFYPPPYDMAKLTALPIVMLGLGLTIIFGAFKVPSLTTSMFAGRAGDHTMPGMGWWRG